MAYVEPGFFDEQGNFLLDDWIDYMAPVIGEGAWQLVEPDGRLDGYVSIFEVAPDTIDELIQMRLVDRTAQPGWYWAPGELTWPSGEAQGPYPSPKDAWAEAVYAHIQSRTKAGKSRYQNGAVPEEYLWDGGFMLEEWLEDMTESEAHGFHQFIDPTGWLYGSFEVFYADADVIRQLMEETGEKYPPGWYWWERFPGASPDSNPVGPFPSAKEAYRDALESQYYHW